MEIRQDGNGVFHASVLTGLLLALFQHVGRGTLGVECLPRELFPQFFFLLVYLQIG